LDLRGRKCQEAGEGCTVRRFCNLYASPNVARIFKSRSMRWGEGACKMHGRDEKCIQNFCQET